MGYKDEQNQAAQPQESNVVTCCVIVIVLIGITLLWRWFSAPSTPKIDPDKPRYEAWKIEASAKLKGIIGGKLDSISVTAAPDVISVYVAGLDKETAQLCAVAIYNDFQAKIGKKTRVYINFGGTEITHYP